MGAIKQMMMEVLDNQSTTELVDRLLERFNGLIGVNEVPTEKLVHLSNVLECEHVNRLSAVYTYSQSFED